MRGIRIIFAIVSSLMIFALGISSGFAKEEFKILSPSYFGDQNNIFEDINYLETEHLSFLVCAEKKPDEISAKLTCKTQTNKTEYLSLVNYDINGGDNCLFTNYDISKFSCDDFRLDINYKVENKEISINRHFKKQRESRIINHLLEEDINTLTPLELSSYLIVLRNLGEVYARESEEIYNTLRDERENLNKCWPKESCSVLTTTQILSNIKEAGYPLSSRLLYDGRIFLEGRIQDRRESETNFHLRITPKSGNTEEITCNINIDNGNELRNSTTTTSVRNENLKLKRTLQVNCNRELESIELTVYNFNNNPFVKERRTNTNSISYTRPAFYCLGEFSSCSLSSSLYALQTYGNTLQYHDGIQNYVNSMIIYDSNNRRVMDSANQFEDIGKLLTFRENQNLFEYLKFNQNNDGSWSQNSIYDKIKQTAWAVLGIQTRDPNSEHLKDGKNWIYFNEPDLGWRDLNNNVLAYRSIKEQLKPHLSLNTINEISGREEINLSNPSIYTIRDIQISFSNEIAENMQYLVNLGNLESGENLKFNISPSPTFTGRKTGYLYLSGVDASGTRKRLIELPINILGGSSLRTETRNHNLDSDNIIVFIPITLTGSSRGQCDYINPFTNLPESLQINSPNAYLRLENPNLVTGPFTGSLNCRIAGSTITADFSGNVEVVERDFITDKPEIVMEEFRDVILMVQSRSSETLNIKINVTGQYFEALVPRQDEITLAPNQTRAIRFNMIDSSFLELVGSAARGNIVLQANSGYVLEIPIVTSKTPGLEPLDLGSPGFEIPIYYYITFSIAFILIIIVLIRYIQLRREEREEENENSEEVDEEEEM